MVITKLKAFIKFLDAEAGFKFDVERFQHRLMLQKYVYIAKLFGLDMGYSPEIYLRGPYSPRLAKDYYALAKTGELYEGDYKRDLPELHARKYLSLIGGKDAEWLEVAATILSLYYRYKGKFFGSKLEESILSTTCDIKSFLPKEKISIVFADLQSASLFAV